MKLELKSIPPDQLIEGQTYLCGSANSAGAIDWTTREFDGENLRICTDGVMLGGISPWPIDEEYMYVTNSGEEEYLIFGLPKWLEPSFS